MQAPDDTSDGSSGSQSLSAHHSILNGDEILFKFCLLATED